MGEEKKEEEKEKGKEKRRKRFYLSINFQMDYEKLSKLLCPPPPLTRIFQCCSMSQIIQRALEMMIIFLYLNFTSRVRLAQVGRKEHIF